MAENLRFATQKCWEITTILPCFPQYLCRESIGERFSPLPSDFEAIMDRSFLPSNNGISSSGPRLLAKAAVCLESGNR